MDRCLFKKLSVECDLEPKIFHREHVCADVKTTVYSGRPWERALRTGSEDLQNESTLPSPQWFYAAAPVCAVA